MRSRMKTLALAALVAGALVAPSTYARDTHGSGDGAMTDPGTMGRGGMMGGEMGDMMTQMRQMMAHCNQMMPGMMENGGQRPNDQWRGGSPAPKSERRD